MRRELSWDGIYNARDLGGLPSTSGMTQFGRFFRTPRLEALTAPGWEQLVSAGVRTVVDLRNDTEFHPSVRPTVITTRHHPIEDQTDGEFMAEWGTKLGSPAYYAENLRRWPDKIAAVFTAMATAPAGGIVFHCSAGRDRTGLIAAMLLSVVGVAKEVIADDYELSVRAFNAFLQASSTPREQPLAPRELALRISENRDHLAVFLDGLDVAAYLVENGLGRAEIAALRERLIRS